MLVQQIGIRAKTLYVFVLRDDYNIHDRVTTSSRTTRSARALPTFIFKPHSQWIKENYQQIKIYTEKHFRLMCRVYFGTNCTIRPTVFLINYRFDSKTLKTLSNSYHVHAYIIVWEKNS